jgi:DNA recombination protein RmuC
MMISILTIILLIVVLMLLGLLVSRSRYSGTDNLDGRFSTFETVLNDSKRNLKEEISHNRSEFVAQAQNSRGELTQNFKTFSDSVKTELGAIRLETTQNAKDLREESLKNLQRFAGSLTAHIGDIAKLQKDQLEIFAKNLTSLTQEIDKNLEAIRSSIDKNLKELREDNSKKLDDMRNVVDVTLHATLEKRLGESFKLVSERLELVHKGLGEMQSLAAGVGDLKKVLTNVKTRGTWGEIQLGNLLEQILTKEQYATNVQTKPGSQERVEFAIRLPGHTNSGKEVWLPVDSKFPLEDYYRLVEAYEKADLGLVEESSKQIETQIKILGKEIQQKYLDPPNTTDFGIMFIPIEGLFAELVRRPGLIEKLQMDRIVIAGPTTFAALLNSLQVGFRTLAIEKRSSEVWSILSAVKTEFGKFGDLLDKTKKKLQETTNIIDDASQRSRAIERKLVKVQELPATDQPGLLEEPVNSEPETEKPPLI